MSQQAPRQQTPGRRILIGALTVLVALVLYWWQSGSGDDPADRADRSSSSSTPDGGTGSSPDSPGDSGDRNDSGLPGIEESDLPPEARDILQAIDAGGPYRYDRDGVVFQNREGLLPGADHGYYHEYTVTTPGSDDRGARRIVTGGDVGAETEFYWTSDHYQSFEVIRR